MTDKKKIRSLYFSTDLQNRSLAFELAKSADCYEEFVEELYAELAEIPDFGEEERYLDEELEEGEEAPSGLLRKRVLLDRFGDFYFSEHMNFSRRWANEEDYLIWQEIPPVVFEFTFAKSLILAYNNIKVIPAEICQLSQLKKLDLSGNMLLKELPDELGQLTDLEELNLEGVQDVFINKHKNQHSAGANYPYEFPSCIRSLKNLKHLQLGGVLLSRYPNWIHELINLETINLYSGWGSHPFLKFGESFTQLPALKRLDISSYSVEIPPDIGQIQTLEFLRIDPALSVPASIGNLKKLKVLDLSWISSDYGPIQLDGYGRLWDLNDKGMPPGVSRLKIYGWEWLKEMTWLEEFIFVHIEPYAFTELERKELQAALPNTQLTLEEK